MQKYKKVQQHLAICHMTGISLLIMLNIQVLNNLESSYYLAEYLKIVSCVWVTLLVFIEICLSQKAIKIYYDLKWVINH